MSKFRAMFVESVQNANEINEGFMRELLNAFKDGYDEENARYALEKEMQAEMDKLAQAEKAIDCKNAERRLKALKRSRGDKSEIRALEGSIEYCSKLGTMRQFIKKNWQGELTLKM